MRLSLDFQLSLLLRPLPLNEIPADHAQVLGRLLDQVAGLGAFLQRAQERGDLDLGVEVGTCASVADVCEAAQAAVLDAGDFQATPSRRMDFVTGGA